MEDKKHPQIYEGKQKRQKKHGGRRKKSHKTVMCGKKHNIKIKNKSFWKRNNPKTVRETKNKKRPKNFYGGKKIPSSIHSEGRKTQKKMPKTSWRPTKEPPKQLHTPDRQIIDSYCLTWIRQAGQTDP